MNDNIFNERGILRSDLHNIRVPPERQGVLDALVSAVMASEEAERQLKLKSAAVDEAVKAHRSRPRRRADEYVHGCVARERRELPAQ